MNETTPDTDGNAETGRGAPLPPPVSMIRLPCGRRNSSRLPRVQSKKWIKAPVVVKMHSGSPVVSLLRSASTRRSKRGCPSSTA